MLTLLFLFRYFKRDENLDRIKTYVKACSIGDWFVLYQMSKNLNRKFFHDFLIVLSKEKEKEACRGIEKIE